MHCHIINCQINKSKSRSTWFLGGYNYEDSMYAASLTD